LGTHHRAQKRDVTRTLGTEALQRTSAAQSDHEVSLQVLQMVIDELLAQFGESQQEIIRLRIEGYKVDDIADKTQRSKRTVERVLQEFRNQLSTLIDVEPQS
jgi:RNA polymerase sigma-70 factor (ECF subfamily)